MKLFPLLAALLIVLAGLSAFPEEAPKEVFPEPPGTQPPDPPEFPTPLPEPEIVTPPEAPPVLIPVEVEWSIPRTDPEVPDILRFVSVYCGTEADPYLFGRWDFGQPGTRGIVELPVPATCHAVAYYQEPSSDPKNPYSGTYRYSEPSPAVLIDPLKPAAPELLPAGMETATLRCAASTQRCVTSRLQTSTKTRDGVRVRSCSCLLVD